MPLTRQATKFTHWVMGEGSTKHTPALFSCGRRVAEKLGPALWFYSLKGKTAELMLHRNFFNWLKKSPLGEVKDFSTTFATRALQGFVRARFTLRPCRWYYKPKRCQPVCIFLSKPYTEVSDFATFSRKIYFRYCFKCWGCSCACTLSNCGTCTPSGSCHALKFKGLNLKA